MTLRIFALLLCTKSCIERAHGVVRWTISYGNKTECSPIRSVIIRVITKSDDRAAGVWFFYHEYFFNFSLFFYYKEIFKVDIFKVETLTKKKSEFQMGFEPTTLRDLVGCSNHWATGDSMVSKGEMCVFDWNRITRSHSQICHGAYELTNCITQSH